MYASAIPRIALTAPAPAASAVAAMFVDECEHDVPGVAIPRPEVHLGVSPKTFAKLSRFRHAVRAARAENHASWATIAARAGYYDQAHLISEFRAIAGVTPRALLGELRSAQSIG